MARTNQDISHIVLRPSVSVPERGHGRAMPVGKVEVGQVYRKTEAFHSLWEVVASFADGSGVRHARLRNIGDPTSIKLIAETALRNPKFYHRVAAAEAPESREAQ